MHKNARTVSVAALWQSAGPGCCLEVRVLADHSRVEDVYFCTDFNLIYFYLLSFIYFFTDFNLIEISRLLDGSITTDVEVYHNVPWYLIFLKTNIDAYLEQSIKAYQRPPADHV